MNFTINIVPPEKAVYCVQCECVSDTPHEDCPACGSRSLISLSRLLNRTPNLGEVTFLLRRKAG